MKWFLQKIMFYYHLIKWRESRMVMDWEKIAGFMFKHINVLEDLQQVDEKVNQLIIYAQQQGGTVTLDQIKAVFGK